MLGYRGLAPVASGMPRKVNPPEFFVFAFFVVVHVLICIALVLIVLLQAGKGGGLSGAFGGGSTAQTLFGGRGAATFLTKTTQWLAAGFMVMSILLAVLSSRSRTQGAGLLQQRARQRAGQATLPPSTSTFNPALADTGGDGAILPGGTMQAPAESASGQAP
jgi:preprotein translocase subunit SecG